MGKMEKEEAISTHTGVMWRPDDTVEFEYVTDGQILQAGDR